MTTKQDIYDFLNSQSLMVVSSVSKDGQPQGAVVGFGQTEDLEIIFRTSELSRKATNILANEKVSAVIGWGSKTVQLDGVARMLSGIEQEEYSEMYFRKTESARKYKDDPHERCFLITPTWLRVTDLTTKPWAVTELEL
jgi:pyridoxine/pyridoxamine 5'-phosphate oxidase